MNFIFLPKCQYFHIQMWAKLEPTHHKIFPSPSTNTKVPCYSVKPLSLKNENLCILEILYSGPDMTGLSRSSSTSAFTSEEREYVAYSRWRNMEQQECEWMLCAVDALPWQRTRMNWIMRLLSIMAYSSKAINTMEYNWNTNVLNGWVNEWMSEWTRCSYIFVLIHTNH